MQFICQWNQRLDFMAALLGTVDYGGGKVIRQDPFSYPVSTADQELTFTNRLICTSVSNIRGLHWWTDGTGGAWGAAGATVADPALPGWGAYVFAVVTAEFTTPLYWITSDPDTPNFDDLLAQTYLITKIKAGGEILAPPFGSIIYDNPGGPHDAEPVLDIGAVQIRTRSEVSCTRVRMPIVPMNAIIAAMNSVNNDVIKIGGYSYPQGSVLLNNVVPTPRSDPFEGGIVWDLEYIFLANAPAGTGSRMPPSRQESRTHLIGMPISTKMATGCMSRPPEREIGHSDMLTGNHAGQTTSFPIRYPNGTSWPKTSGSSAIDSGQ